MAKMFVKTCQPRDHKGAFYLLIASGLELIDQVISNHDQILRNYLMILLWSSAV